MINLAKLNRVRVSGDTVVAQAGAWWEDVYLEMNDTSAWEGRGWGKGGRACMVTCCTSCYVCTFKGLG